MHNHHYHAAFRRAALLVGAFWLALFIAGRYSSGLSVTLMSNDRCFAALGCNVGFFGYDALEHFVAGMLEIFILFWVSLAYPLLDTLPEPPIKRTFVLLSIAAFFAYLWEILEYAGDVGRIYLFHESIVHPNFLWQANNADTMGDMTLALAGSALAILASLALIAHHRFIPLEAGRERQTLDTL